MSTGDGDQFRDALLEGSATPECLSELCLRLRRCSWSALVAGCSSGVSGAPWGGAGGAVLGSMVEPALGGGGTAYLCT